MPHGLAPLFWTDVTVLPPHSFSNCLPCPLCHIAVGTVHAHSNALSASCMVPLWRLSERFTRSRLCHIKHSSQSSEGMPAVQGSQLAGGSQEIIRMERGVPALLEGVTEFLIQQHAAQPKQATTLLQDKPENCSFGCRCELPAAHTKIVKPQLVWPQNAALRHDKHDGADAHSDLGCARVDTIITCCRIQILFG